MASAPSKRQSGQAAVEAALTLPLVLFVMLGTLQLFMMFHARIVTQLAAYRATRAGSVSHANCNRMVSAAVLQLLPAIHPFLTPQSPGATPGEKMALAWRAICGGGFVCRDTYAGSGLVINDGGRSVAATRDVVWIRRRLGGRQAIIGGGGQDTEFDQAPGGGPNGSSSQRMETEVIFWFPMKIPFANWVMSKMVMSYWGIESYNARNPLMEAGKANNANSYGANWNDPSEASNLPAAIQWEMKTRMDSGEYVFPITATFGMRMMTPVKVGAPDWVPGAPNCPPTPPAI